MFASPGLCWSAAVLALVALAQLAMGADVLVLSLCLLSVVVGLAKLAVLGRDFYTLLIALFCFRYTAGAVVLKTFYGQPVQQYLLWPKTSFLLCSILFAAITASVLAARRLDTGRSVFPRLTHIRQLRMLATVAFASGTLAAVVQGLAQDRLGNLVGAGAVGVVASAFSNFVFLGIASEVFWGLQVSSGRKLFTVRVLVMLTIVVAIAIFLNVRSLIVNAGVCVVFIGILTRTIRPRHIAVTALGLYAFSSFLSPMMLELREYRYNSTAQDFSSVAFEIVFRAITDPRYLDNLKAQEKIRNQFETGLVQYDYFGDNSNIGNRLSFVGLVDAVYAKMEIKELIGTRAYTDEVIPRVMPSFLGSKQARDYGYGDWLSWETGMIESNRIAFLSFSLPVEGLAVFGFVGFVLLPSVSLFLVLLAIGRIQTLMTVGPLSAYLFGALHWYLVEGASDVYISMLIRVLPLLCVPVWLFLWTITRQRAVAVR